MSTALARLRAHGRGEGSGGFAVPLALRPAARIQERDWAEFCEDPTQLANGLRDLIDAICPDGITVSLPDLLLEQGSAGLIAGRHAFAAFEATRRLRASQGDRVAVVACLPGPAAVEASLGCGSDAAAEQLLVLGQEFLAAGSNLILVLDADAAAPQLTTLANIARFHQSVLATIPAGTGLPAVARISLESPTSAVAIVVTDTDLPRDTDLAALEDWVERVRG